MTYMLDTNICIYYIKNKPPQVMTAFHTHRHEGICISSITLAELEHGVAASAFPQKNTDALNQFLAIVEVLPFDNDAAHYYGSVRAHLKKQPIGSLDMLIASHALSQKLTLVTNNEREFTRIQGLTIENWTTIQ